MEKISKKSTTPKKSKEKQKNEKKNSSSSKKKNKTKSKTNNPTMLSIYLGTYEGKLIVNNINIKTKENISNFSLTSSQNAIRTIYHKLNSLFVSGTDEIIHMYNIHKKMSEGDLMTYTGTVNDIKIHDNYLIVAGENNTIPIWRMSDFNNIIELKGHKKAINSIDIHTSGGFLVSGGRDNCVIIFDLLTGRKVEKFEFDYICNKVQLFDKDKYLMVVFDLRIFILDLMKNANNENDNIIQKLNFTKKIINAYIIKNKLIIVFSDAEIKTYELNIKDEDNNDKNDENKEEKKEKEKKEDIEEKEKIEEDKEKEEKEDEKIININSELKIILEKPEKKNENDLEIRVRYVSISKIDKIKIITISYSNNEVYFYDLNKIVKLEELENKTENKDNNNLIKKYGKIQYNIPGKITALDSELTK
jgi:WD40 repeat protein